TAKSLLRAEWEHLRSDSNLRLLQKGDIDEEDLLRAAYALLAQGDRPPPPPEESQGESHA
ncbi:MAG: hypothetical protein RRA94_05835, partial [Bacteroidota bacterium]|nr:hypothetical protein [Bacteroidota bacterium]